MRHPLILFFVALICCNISAQTLHGRISDKNDESVPNATLYFREISLGIVANEDGLYRTQLKSGHYTCEISSLGFEKKIVNIDITSEDKTLDIKLDEKSYLLKEVSVVPGKEDPAYRIMRQVIANAPYYYRQVRKYDANIYFKGSLKIDKIPKLIEKQIKQKEYRDMIGKIFVYESENELKYTAPDKFEQRVVAVRSSIPDDVDSMKMLVDFKAGFIYSPYAFGGLLSKNSFSVYKFHLEDSYKDGDYLINKIQVTPKKKNGNLASGWIYIVDGQWTVNQVQLSMYEMGMTATYNYTYKEVKKDAFLPVAYDFGLKIDKFGLKGGGKFYASIQYNDLSTISATQSNVSDSSKDNDSKNLQKPQTKRQAKAEKQLEALASKENLTNREMRKMTRLMQESMETEEERKKRKSLEIVSYDSLHIYKIDSLALKRDSTYWQSIRHAPLSDEELLSYLHRDSIKNVLDSVYSADSVKNASKSNWTSKIVFGDNKQFNKEKYYIKYDGLLRGLLKEYNFVDGFWLGQSAEFGMKFRHHNSFSINPAAYYTTARKNVVWGVNAKLLYAPKHFGELTASVGDKSLDFAGIYGGSRHFNSLMSLIYAKNFVKFYRAKYAEISNKIELVNGFYINSDFRYEHRNALENNTSYSFFGHDPKSNMPHGQTIAMPTHEAYIATVGIRYAPRQYYTIDDGKKHIRYIKSPIFQLQYQKAFGGGLNNRNADFEMLQAQISQSVRVGIFSSLIYGINAGKFLSRKHIYFPDFRHFETNESLLSEKSFYFGFNTIDNYIRATDDKWLQTHLNYESNYLLLKNLPFLQGYMFDETLHFHTLRLPGYNHQELGYSIGFGDLGRFVVSVGFDKMKYKNVAFTITIPIARSLQR